MSFKLVVHRICLVLMALWTLYWAFALFQMANTAIQGSKTVGGAIGGGIGLGLAGAFVFFYWLFPVVFLGIIALLTRPKN